MTKNKKYDPNKILKGGERKSDRRKQFAKRLNTFCFFGNFFNNNWILNC